MLILAVNTYDLNEKFFVIFLGISYGFIAFLDFAHIITVQRGIGVFGQITLSEAFSLGARLLESISILIACIIIYKRLRFKLRYIVAVYFAITLTFIFLIYKFHLVNIDDETLCCSLRLIINLITTFFLILSLWPLVKSRDNLDEKTYAFISMSIFISITSALFLRFHMNISYISFIIVHNIKFLSFYFLYRAILQTNIRYPYERLRRSEMKYRKLIEASPDGIVIYGERNIFYINSRFREIFNMPNEIDLNIQTIYNQFCKECAQLLRTKYKGIMSGKVIDGFEQITKNCNNKKLSLEVLASSMLYNGEKAVLLIVRDINERIKAQELEQNRRALEQSILYDRMKTEFISNIAHDLRTPLNIILGTTQLMNIINDDTKIIDHNKLNKYNYMIKQNSYRLLKLINNLIDMTKLDNKSFTMNYKRYNIVSIVENIVLSVANYVESKGIQIIFDTTIEEKIISCDADQIERVILNLISNAVKFTQPNGEININIYEENNNIVMTIADTGIGIPKDLQENIFDRFRQLDTPLHKKHEGSGIGLSLVKSIIEEHKGSISVKSEVGKGSEFIIKLPIILTDIVENSYEEVAASIMPNIERINIEFSDIYS